MGILFLNEVEYLKKECICLYLLFVFFEEISVNIVEKKVMKETYPDLERKEEFSI